MPHQFYIYQPTIAWHVQPHSREKDTMVQHYVTPNDNFATITSKM